MKLNTTKKIQGPFEEVMKIASPPPPVFTHIESTCVRTDLDALADTG